MEELRQLDTKCKQLVKNVNKSVDEFFQLLSRCDDTTHPCLHLKQCQFLKCLYVLEQFHGSLCRKILEQQIKIKELQDDGNPFNNEFEMLRNYVNFRNYAEKDMNPNNMIKNFMKAAGLAGFDPEMLDLLQKLTINELIKFQ